MTITLMAILRWRLIQLIDLFDDRLIGHRFYSLCTFCGESDWWEAGFHRPGATCPVDWDRYREYAPYPSDVIDMVEPPQSLPRTVASWLRGCQAKHVAADEEEAEHQRGDARQGDEQRQGRVHLVEGAGDEGGDPEAEAAKHLGQREGARA